MTKKTIEEHHEVELPCYVNSGTILFYKIYSETKCLAVCTLDGHVEIGTKGVNCALNGKYSQCSKEEFEHAYNEALKKLKP